MIENHPDLPPVTPEDDAMVHFLKEVDEWQRLLDGLSSDDPDYDGYIAEATNSLDALCPYVDQIVYARGRGHVPILGYKEGETFPTVIDNSLFMEGQTAIHRGVRVLVEQDQEDTERHARIFYMVALGTSVGYATELEFRNATFYAYLRIEPATIISTGDEIDNALSIPVTTEALQDDASEKPSLDDLRKHSKIVRDTLSSTMFRQLTKDQQRGYLQKMVEVADSEISLRNVAVSLPARCVRCISVREDGEITINTYHLQTELPISGVVMGVESLENIRLHMNPAEDIGAIRSDEDLIDGSVGLHCVISPDPVVREGLQLKGDNQLIYIPAIPE